MRPGMTTAYRFLELQDQKSREHRARRMAKLVKVIQMPRHGFLMHGAEVTSTGFEEARLAYVNGLYLSCIMVSLLVVERHIAGLLYGAGYEPAKEARAIDLVKEASKRALLNNRQMKNIERLRKIRNDYAHFRGFNRTDSNFRRSVELRLAPFLILAKDATLSLQVMAEVMNQTAALR